MRKDTIPVMVISFVVIIIFCDKSPENKLHYQKSVTIKRNLIIYTPHHKELVNPMITEFENRTGITVEVRIDSTKKLLEKIVTDANCSQCDVYWGRAISMMAPLNDCFEKFISENEAYVMEAFKNRDSTTTMFTNMPSVILVNTNLLENTVVKGYQDLLNPVLTGKIAFADPEASSSSYEHLVNILFAMGNGNHEKGWSYVRQFVKQLDGNVLTRSRDVYLGVAKGQYTVGLTFEEGAARMVSTGAPVKIIYMKEGVIFRPDGIYIVKSAKNIENARKFVNFCTCREVQTLMASRLKRRSVRKDVFPAKGLTSYDKINIIHDDQYCAFYKKFEWVSRFNKELQSHASLVKSVAIH